ncbi:tRNAHis guanylyltransferase Thg1 superfamily protein [Babesia gibsoni]|uniref:tRNA(His) guanylyltransferase n=1 Tax=Babesia gibsoni TaxID=33632 RepID=A0AAD8LMF7_BABGI|nr:tRNAHis guanylyltransferase Thg1 superfamily protein [Babesia gibsoni]
MANTRFAYVKQFEQESSMLPDCWPLIRLDGRSFTAFSKSHKFRKPSEPLALGVMNAAAAHVMSTFDDIVLAYGHSDEYRKILSSIVSTFSSAYCYHWSTFFPSQPLLSLPTFDGRIVLYPRFDHVVDYFSWRHADCHINTQYNICFWCLVADGKNPDEAYKWLKHTNKGEKNEYIYQSRGINYNNLPRLFRKGTTLVRMAKDEPEVAHEQMQTISNSRVVPMDTDASNCSSSNDVIALVIEESEISDINLKVKRLCDQFKIGIICCDNISADFWKTIAPSYDIYETDRARDKAPSISALTVEQISLLNTQKE